MKLFKNLKKGFTLIELVVVIAVIAILSAVSVVSYVAITNKAKNSNDETVLRQVNMAIAMRKTETEPATMSDALLALKEEGGISDVEKLLTATYSKNSFAYDQENKEFVLIKEGEEPEKAQRRRYFKMVSNSDELEKANGDGYSCYLKKGYSESVTTSYQLDVGENSNISSISYTSSSSEGALIRTNGGTLTVGAPNDTIYHYGMAQQVDISSVAQNDCYHEYGTVKGQLNITKGKVVLESKANVGFVNVTATSASDINVEIKSGSDYGRLTCKDETILNAVASAAKIPAEKTMKTVEGTVAILNNTPYTSLDSAIAAFVTEGSTFELFSDIINNDMTTTKKVVMPSSATFDGHGYMFTGNSSLTLNSLGGTIKNTVFEMISDSAITDEKTKEHYKMGDKTGKVSAITCGSLTGKAVIRDCIFNSISWDAIQITPKAGAKIEIKNNVFKTSFSNVERQMRFIHIETGYVKDTKVVNDIAMNIEIANNDFYDYDLLQETGVEIYWLKDKANLTISDNFFNGIDLSKTYTNSEMESAHISCIGYGNVFANYNNYCLAVLNKAKTTANH